MVRYTYDNDDTAEPQHLFVQHPNPIAEVSLNDERSHCGHYGNVYGGEMGIPEMPHFTESGNKPIVKVGPSQRRLSGLK